MIYEKSKTERFTGGDAARVNTVHSNMARSDIQNNRKRYKNVVQLKKGLEQIQTRYNEKQSNNGTQAETLVGKQTEKKLGKELLRHEEY